MAVLSQLQTLSLNQLTPPCLRLNIDIATGVQSIPADIGGIKPACVWIVVSLFTEPLGCLLAKIPASGLTAESVSAAVEGAFKTEIEGRLGSSKRGSPEDSAFLSSRLDVLESAPNITIAVCTRERPERLAACLPTLLAQEYPNFAIVVVDNAPVTHRTREVIESIDSPRITYVLQQRKGLSNARNTAIDASDAEIVAQIDDDELADPHWLAELARGFHDYPEADAIAGMMLPAELDTWPQIWFEQYGGFNKHRGFTRTLFSPSVGTQSPLYPLPPFGAGGNLAYRTSAMRRVGGFNCALGPGTASLASEDTRLFTDLLRTGGSVLYQPTAITFHFHRRGMDELRKQTYAYGAGLTAFYSSLIVESPRCLPQLVKLIPQAYRDLFSGRSLRSGDLPADYPKVLRNSNIRGMAAGPAGYLRARAAVNR